MNMLSLIKRINEFEDKCISRGGYTDTDEVWDIFDEIRKTEFATDTEIEAARALYETDDVQIDDGAVVSRCESGEAWVQAWVYIYVEPEEETE